jgi:hypothetical protein
MMTTTKVEVDSKSSYLGQLIEYIYGNEIVLKETRVRLETIEDIYDECYDICFNGGTLKTSVGTYTFRRFRTGGKTHRDERDTTFIGICQDPNKASCPIVQIDVSYFFGMTVDQVVVVSDHRVACLLGMSHLRIQIKSDETTISMEISEGSWAKTYYRTLRSFYHSQPVPPTNIGTKKARAVPERPKIAPERMVKSTVANHLKQKRDKNGRFIQGKFDSPNDQK